MDSLIATHPFNLTYGSKCSHCQLYNKHTETNANELSEHPNPLVQIIYVMWNFNIFCCWNKSKQYYVPKIFK